MNKYLRTPLSGARCPFCSHDAGRVLYTVTSAEAATHFISPWRNAAQNEELRSVIERLWKKSSCQVVECGHCAGAFAYPFVGGDSEFYRVTSVRQKSGAYPTDRWEYGESIRCCGELQDASLKTATALEIGAGDGAFVKRLIRAGVQQRTITVLEYSSYAKESIRSNYQEVHIYNGDELPTLSSESFSHVFLFQVLEHLGNLNFVMFQLHRLLNRNGLAFISVPSPSRIEFNELNDLTLDMPPNHISRFSDGAVKNLALRNGFSVERLIDEEFSWQEMVPQYLLLRYIKLAQSRESIPGRIDANLGGMSRKLAAGLFAMTVLPSAVLRLKRGGRIGGSRLIVLRKNPA